MKHAFSTIAFAPDAPSAAAAVSHLQNESYADIYVIAHQADANQPIEVQGLRPLPALDARNPVAKGAGVGAAAGGVVGIAGLMTPFIGTMVLFAAPAAVVAGAAIGAVAGAVASSRADAEDAIADIAAADEEQGIIPDELAEVLPGMQQRLEKGEFLLAVQTESPESAERAREILVADSLPDARVLGWRADRGGHQIPPQPPTRSSI